MCRNLDSFLEREVTLGRHKEPWDTLEGPRSGNCEWCLNSKETQPRKALSSPCVASEDAENIRNTISQRSDYVVLSFAPGWPGQSNLACVAACVRGKNWYVF